MRWIGRESLPGSGTRTCGHGRNGVVMVTLWCIKMSIPACFLVLHPECRQDHGPVVTSMFSCHLLSRTMAASYRESVRKVSNSGYNPPPRPPAFQQKIRSPRCRACRTGERLGCDGREHCSDGGISRARSTRPRYMVVPWVKALAQARLNDRLTHLV